MEVKGAKMSHTPGPWAVIANAELPERMQLIRVAGGDEGKANARLLRAAPEMFEILASLISSKRATWAGERVLPIGPKRRAEIEAILAKAKGDAPGNGTKKKVDGGGEGE